MIREKLANPRIDVIANSRSEVKSNKGRVTSMMLKGNLFKIPGRKLASVFAGLKIIKFLLSFINRRQ